VSSTGAAMGQVAICIPVLRRAGNAAVQHSETVLRRNWASVCATALDALVPHKRARDCIEDALRGGTRILRVRHRTTDDEDICTCARGGVRCTDAGLVVARAVVETDTGNDGDEVAARIVHTSDLMYGAHHATAATLDRGRETRVELTRVGVTGEHGDRDRDR
jgi:hypothetical protein